MAIIKYRVEATITHTNEGDEQNVVASSWQYEECYNPEIKGRLLTREEAQRRIREDGMVLVHSTPYGAVYDTPDEPFWEKHNGYYSRHKRKL